MIKTEKNGLFLTLAAFMLALISALLLFTVAPKRPAKADEPQASLICTFDVSGGATINFNIISFTSVNWGDGTVNDSASHTYSNTGVYTVSVYGLTTISNGMMNNGGENIRSAVIGNSITFIEDGAFYESSLESVIIGSNVTEIGMFAFAMCPNLTSVRVYATTPPVFNDNAFSIGDDRSLEEILVPASSVDAYKADTYGWAYFADIISAIPEEEPETPDEPTESNETTEPENSETNNEGKKPLDFGEWIYNAGEDVSAWISDNVGIATTGSTVLIVGAIIIIVLIFRRRR